MDVPLILRYEGCQNKALNSVLLLISDIKVRERTGSGFPEGCSVGPQWFGIDWFQDVMD